LEDHESGPAKVVTDRQIELLLKQKASVLHLSAANYCWFEDPEKALCLKLAGTKAAAAPMTGLCDSSRCPQATHHLVHRPVWQTAGRQRRCPASQSSDPGRGEGPAAGRARAIHAGSRRITRLVADAVAAGVQRLVLLSAHGVGRADDSHPLKAAEQAVRDSGIDWTILQPDWFAPNFSESFWLPGVLAGTLALPTGDGRTPFVDAEDVAEDVAAVLTEDRHSGQTYQLTGPRVIASGPGCL
jgi:hypothetical protein